MYQCQTTTVAVSLLLYFLVIFFHCKGARLLVTQLHVFYYTPPGNILEHEEGASFEAMQLIVNLLLLLTLTPVTESSLQGRSDIRDMTFEQLYLLQY